MPVRRAVSRRVLLALAAVAVLAALGCQRGDDRVAEAGRAAPAPRTADSEAVRVEPMVALGDPGPAKLEVEPSDSDTSRFVIEEESGQVHQGEVTIQDQVTAEDLSLPLPEGAVRLAGAQVGDLQSTNPMIDPSLSGSLAVVYQCDQSVDEVVAFYVTHDSGRFGEVEAELMGQVGWRILLDSESDRVIGVTSSEAGVTQITLLDTPAGA